MLTLRQFCLKSLLADIPPSLESRTQLPESICLLLVHLYLARVESFENRFQLSLVPEFDVLVRVVLLEVLLTDCEWSESRSDETVPCRVEGEREGKFVR